jgi:anaerobic magnesium-protoporphyrin IX monomethyl ester cyclase
MVRETEPDDIGVSVAYPLPGTKFHDIVSARIGPKTNWRDSADLALTFQGAYSNEFYRALADALHREVRGEPNLDAAWRLVYELRECFHAVEAAV